MDISDILIKLLILATELAIKFKMYFVSFIKWIFLVWGMHFLSLKQLIADKEKSAIYRQYQFMEEKRCISKSSILLNEVIWLKKATPCYNIFCLIFCIMRVYNSLQIRRWHLISFFYILPAIHRCEICKLYKCEICNLLSLPFFGKKFNLLIQMCTFEHSCTQCYHGNNKCEIWNTFMCCIKIIAMKNTTHCKYECCKICWWSVIL